MIENQTSETKAYTHGDMRNIFGLDRQIRLTDISA